MNPASCPNILWICTDQQRFDTLNCMGNEWVHTPHLDRLAQEGVLFENAFCQNPVCTPSRASFLTGRYPRTTRARQNGQSIPADEVLVTKLLADAGYACGLSGKLHLSACHASVAPLQERRIDDGYSVFQWSHDPSRAWPTNEYHLWLREQQVEYTVPPFEGSKFVQEGMPEEFHHTTWCVQQAATFIEENARFERPWCFSLNIYDPHFPFDPPLKYLGRYLDRLDEIPLPDFTPGELDDKPPFQKGDHGGGPGQGKWKYLEMSERDHRLLRAAYWAMCDLIDAQVGRLLQVLEATGQRENTLVIFMSDHGEMLGDHGLYLKGPFFYEPAVHVPLILSQPGALPSGERRSSLVELCDLAPTLLEASGLPSHEGMQGRSLWSLARGTSVDAHREDVYCEYLNSMPVHRDPPAHCTMLRTEDFKIVAAHGTGQGELYDLRADPGETRNLWSSAQHREVKCELLERLCDRIAFTMDPLPARQAPF